MAFVSTLSENWFVRDKRRPRKRNMIKGPKGYLAFLREINAADI